MFGVGDYVAYNEDGVCRVEQVGTLSIPVADRDQCYYTLRPISESGKIYVPVDTALPMRPVLSREEAMALIRQIPGVEAEVSQLSNKRMLEEHYRSMMKPHTPLALVKTLKSMYEKRTGGEKLRSLSSTDEYYRKRAEALLYQELAVALEIPADTVESFIANTIDAGA